jgi:hypothetical protein
MAQEVIAPDQSPGAVAARRDRPRSRDRLSIQPPQAGHLRWLSAASSGDRRRRSSKYLPRGYGLMRRHLPRR